MLQIDRKRLLLAAGIAGGALLLALIASPRAVVQAATFPVRALAAASSPKEANPKALKRPSTAAYDGIGTWVDVYDGPVFDTPEKSVAAMYARGVRTIYVETANSGSKFAIYRPDGMGRLIEAAHARKMKVVAWYLPTLLDPEKDYSRIRQAYLFRSAHGQRFDSFALDIESSKVTSVAERNKRLVALSKRIRLLTGRMYPLGAIIPSPMGMAKNKTYWPNFPYAELAPLYDALLPMTYYTYHWNGPEEVAKSMADNVTLIRSQPGWSAKPIHMIGGIANESSVAEVRAFSIACRDLDVAGVSLYDWRTTYPSLWPEIARFKQ